MLDRLTAMVTASRKLSAGTKRKYITVLSEYLTNYAWSLEGATAYYSELLTRHTARVANSKFAAVTWAGRRLAAQEQNAVLNVSAYVETDKPEQETRTRASLTLDQVQQLRLAIGRLPSPRRERDYAMFLLFVTTGMRREGLVGIQLSDMEEDPVRGPIVTITLKGGARWRVPLPPKTHAAIHVWTEMLRASGVTTGPLFRPLPASGVNAQTTSKRQLTADGAYRLVKDWAERARLDATKISPHIFRHTFVTQAVAAGASHEEIAGVTGHIPGTGVIGRYTDRGSFGRAAQKWCE